jgi:ectoine hydroxylase-related dioxygenase (phytanoyl-CoA dioxygenase family)
MHIAGAGGFDAHTDAPAYQHSGALKHLTINIAVDAATSENGCLEVVDGSHKMCVSLLYYRALPSPSLC